MKNTICLVLLLSFSFSAHSQFNKKDFFLSTGVTINNIKFSKLPVNTLELQPIQATYMINKNLGIGLSTNYRFQEAGESTTFKDFTTYVNVRGILNSSFFIKPYLQFAAGIGNYKTTLTTINRLTPNIPAIIEVWNAKTINYAPAIGAMISFSQRIGLDINYQYQISNIKYKRTFYTINEQTVKDSKINCSIFFRFIKKE